MIFNQQGVEDLFAAIVSEAGQLGVFETVNTHEPKSAPGTGLRCSIWIDTVKPLRSSGLAMTSGLVSFFARVYNNMLQEPQDDIDPAITSAVFSLMGQVSGDYAFSSVTTLDIRNVDLLGAYGEGLAAQAGYMQIDNGMYRVMVLNVPVVVNDLWSQEP